MSAWMLLDKGYRVTILAKDWAWLKDFHGSRITSQIAGALWEMPPGGCGLTEIADPAPGYANLANYQQWALQSYEFYCKYAALSNEHEQGGWSLGLKISRLHQFFYDNIFESQNTEHYKKCVAMQEHNGTSFNVHVYETHDSIFRNFNKDTVFNSNYGGAPLQSAYTHDAPILDKSLAYLMAIVMRKGANLETREVTKLHQTGDQILKDFQGHAILNATGLGAHDLVGDKDVYPVRGAIRRVENTRHSQFRHLNNAYLVPAQVDNNGQPTKTVFIVPRNDDIL